jgi:hypothetical protein
MTFFLAAAAEEAGLPLIPLIEECCRMIGNKASEKERSRAGAADYMQALRLNTRRTAGAGERRQEILRPLPCAAVLKGRFP